MRVFDRYSIAACALVILALPCSVEAQRGDCSYTRCSLRVEGGLLVRGPNEVVGRTTLTGMPSLASLVGAADSAQYYARQFDRVYPRSRWLAVASGALLGLGLGIALDRIDAPERSFVAGLGVSGAALAGMSFRYDRKAQQALSRALWWHNAGLPGS